ncbi:leucine-rich repeat-containing protein 27 isoform X1 [Nematostella vectensis]|uniref:leucine-rich repeat-containing protein 27 isoform X1 n=1 Tax=Nematostella vectensis TaxID=45351 RepID=UPI0020772C89|nr:leucine-rich repeat-containing protein 27 isoform X1 [Nematostella vectensis]
MTRNTARIVYMKCFSSRSAKIRVQKSDKMAVGDGVEQLLSTAAALGTTTLDLNRKNLIEIPPKVLDLQHLEFLYLEGNYLTTLPETLFERLPNLKWLDLRNNHINEVPENLGAHRCLKNLLLEGNNIRTLPFELGFIKSLSGLNLASNPLENPPPQVVEKGTQEVLRFLREQFSDREKASGHCTQVKSLSASSSDEDLSNPREFSRATVPDQQPIVTEYECLSPEKVRLPPIIQAAASRSRNRTLDSPETLLQGQKAKQFVHEKQKAVIVSEANPPKSPIRQIRESVSRNNSELSPKKEHKEIEEKHKVIRVKVESKKQITEPQRLEEKEEKQRKRTKSRGVSPNKEPKPKKKSSEPVQNPSYDLYKPVTKTTAKPKTEVQKIDIEGRREVLMKVDEITAKTHGMAVKEEVDYSELRDLVDASNFHGRLNLKEGDMIAIKVPDKLYIKGQPCLGKITSLPNTVGQLTVHYYTGTYDGYWRPMMSRTSPYLRKVPLTSVLCKFKVSTDGRMSPVTAAKVRHAVDADRKEHI